MQIISFVLPLLKDCLINLKQYEKFFLLFYLVLQFITKIQTAEMDPIEKSVKEEITECVKQFLISEIFTMNISNKNLIISIFKSLSLAISQNYDITIKSILEKIIIYLLESGNIINYIWSCDELQGLILTFILSTDDITKRRLLVHLVILFLNDHYLGSNYDIWKLTVYILKLLSKDFDYLRDIAVELDSNLLASLDNLIKIQQIQAQKQAEAKAEKENSDQKNANVMRNNMGTNAISQNAIENKTSQNQTAHSIQAATSTEKSSTGGPRLKALKFGK